MMRIWRALALPWLALALLLQLNAPTQAAMMAGAMSQPPGEASSAAALIASPPMCGAMHKGAGRPGAPMRDDCCAGCPVCSVAHACALLVDAASIPAASVRLIPAPRLYAAALGPRGPPPVRPKARAPPIPA